MIRTRPINHKRQLFYPLLLVMALLLTTGIFVVEEDSIRIVPIFVLVFLLGSGLVLGLGLSRGGLAGLLMISLWIATKQITGIWTVERLWTSAVELVMMGSAFFFSGILHDRVRTILTTLTDAQERLKQLDFEDTAVGLIKPSIGLLRLKEEEDRSARFHRPFALALVKVSSLGEVYQEPGEEAAIMRAVAADVKDMIRQADFPFLTPSNRIAIILPETDENAANRALERIRIKLSETRYIHKSGKSIPIQERVRIHFGLATFTGLNGTRVDALEAAEEVLLNNLIVNAGISPINPSTEPVVVSQMIHEPAWAVENTGLD